MPVWREDEEGRGTSLIITREGREAVGIDSENDSSRDAATAKESRRREGQQPSPRDRSTTVDEPRSGSKLIQLTVERDNEQARSLYARLSFLEYGVEKNALKQDGRYYDEVFMAKALLGYSSRALFRASTAIAG
jgi:hypothetical protein